MKLTKPQVKIMAKKTDLKIKATRICKKNSETNERVSVHFDLVLRVARFVM